MAKEYAWNYKSGDDGHFAKLVLTAKLRGAAAALQLNDEWKKSGSTDAKTEEQMLNGLGYQLLYGGKKADGVAVFEENVKRFPQSANVYDSLGEGYMETGKKDLAIQNYEKSLQLKADNPNAVERLKKLRAQ